MTEVPSLWNDRFAPITWSIGFLRIPLSEAVEGLASWRRRLHGSVNVTSYESGLLENIRRLEPITSAITLPELVVATENPEWTAFFDNGHGGPDQVSRISYLCGTLQVFAVDSNPHIPPGQEMRENHGALQFQMFGALSTDFLNYVRVVSLVRDGSHYHFTLTGTTQEFEQFDAYESRRVADRFTPKMLVSYCSALGLKPWDDSFYPGAHGAGRESGQKQRWRPGIDRILAYLGYREFQSARAA